MPQRRARYVTPARRGGIAGDKSAIARDAVSTARRREEPMRRRRGITAARRAAERIRHARFRRASPNLRLRAGMTRAIKPGLPPPSLHVDRDCVIQSI